MPATNRKLGVLSRLHAVKQPLLRWFSRRRLAKRSLIGSSLSACISCILSNRVREDQVVCIVTQTMCRVRLDCNDWDNLIEDYKRVYWNRDPKEAEAIFWRFIKAGKIIQPRLDQRLDRSLGDIPMEGWGDAIWLDAKTHEPVLIE